MLDNECGNIHPPVHGKFLLNYNGDKFKAGTEKRIQKKAPAPQR
jgi:hypothetical protein